jgi:hypothetical protein
LGQVLKIEHLLALKFPGFALATAESAEQKPLFFLFLSERNLTDLDLLQDKG